MINNVGFFVGILYVSQTKMSEFGFDYNVKKEKKNNVKY